MEYYNKIILYTPTYRDKGKVSPCDELYWINFQSWLVKYNNVFIIKKHISDHKLKIPVDYENIYDISDKVNDVQELLTITGILISDYSGIVTDFSLTIRPIIFYVYCIDNYLRVNRDFYYDLKTTLPGPFLYNQDELLKFVQDLSWFYDKNYQRKYKKFQDRFNKYKDGYSSERFVNIKKEL